MNVSRAIETSENQDRLGIRCSLSLCFSQRLHSLSLVVPLSLSVSCSILLSILTGLFFPSTLHNFPLLQRFCSLIAFAL